MKIIDGKGIAEEIYQELKDRLSHLKDERPKLVIILASNDEPSQVYVGLKKRKAEELGIACEVVSFDEKVVSRAIMKKIEELNNDPTVTGILVQLPLFAHLRDESDDILNMVDPKKDIDGLSDSNQDLSNGKYKEKHISATALAVIKCIEYAHKGQDLSSTLKGKNILILNRSRLIGKPLASYLSNFTDLVHAVGKGTDDLEDMIGSADILISATGNIGLIKGSDIKEGAIVIDVTSKKDIDGKTKGDISYDEELVAKASYYTPVPGGVGPITVACLLHNVVSAYYGDKQSN
jgi:methylenetetrahydrofolate dehydrogenase (NADP+)/methenyltetrahydrofolate cyclohydrolase